MLRQEDYEVNAQQIPEASGRETVPAQDESFGDFIVKYVRNTDEPPDLVEGASFLPINEFFGVIYAPLKNIGELQINSYFYNSIPKCYTYMDLESLNASGVTRLHNHPYLNLRGGGTAVAVIDSGISYENPLFRDSGGFTRIAYLWDQTLEGEAGEAVPYGRLFTAADINRALQSGSPLDIVPSVDSNGHGTALAGIAAGNTNARENFSGAAPEASLIVVKLKPAKRFLKEFYLYPAEAEIFQENDIMLGIAYALKWGRSLGVPLSICLGLGTSQGAHVGESPLSQYINYTAGFSQISVSVAGGNEGAARHHFSRELSPLKASETAELKVGENEPGFTLEFWGSPLEDYELSIQSPTGETLKISSSLGAGTQELSFVFVETIVLVNYVAIERQTGSTLVYFRFFHPAAGIWKITVTIQDGSSSGFHMWLPVTGLISPETYFLEASPYNTVTSPGDAIESITATAYQYRDNSLYLAAGRGFMPDGAITPDLAAPGVDIRVPLVGGGFGKASGTSLSAAMTAGVAALLFEWAVIRGNQPFFTGTNVKHYLERGARRDEGILYPSREWGYGRLDLYHTFELLS